MDKRLLAFAANERQQAMDKKKELLQFLNAGDNQKKRFATGRVRNGVMEIRDHEGNLVERRERKVEAPPAPVVEEPVRKKVEESTSQWASFDAAEVPSLREEKEDKASFIRSLFKK